MEIQKVGKTNVRIKAKSVSFVTDTFASGESIPLFFKPKTDESYDGFFIEGAGEYEVTGVRIKGIQEGDGLLYEITEEPITLKLINTQGLKAMKDIDEGTILLVENNGELTKDTLVGLDAYLTIVYGEPIPDSTFQQIEKINLRKLEELKGVVVLK